MNVIPIVDNSSPASSEFSRAPSSSLSAFTKLTSGAWRMRLRRWQSLMVPPTCSFPTTSLTWTLPTTLRVTRSRLWPKSRSAACPSLAALQPSRSASSRPARTCRLHLVARQWRPATRRGTCPTRRRPSTTRTQPSGRASLPACAWPTATGRWRMSTREGHRLRLPAACSSEASHQPCSFPKGPLPTTARCCASGQARSSTAHPSSPCCCNGAWCSWFLSRAWSF